jgi:hypothetical protein
MAPILHILHVDQDEGARQLLSRAIFKSSVAGTLHSNAPMRRRGQVAAPFL